MLNNRPKFQIISIVANELDLLSVTLPTSIDSLTKNASCDYEVVLQVDGANDESMHRFIDLRNQLSIDELRIRNKQSKDLICPGDPSNNSHFHTLSNKCEYVIEIESDVIAVLQDKNYDALGEIIKFFEKHSSVCIATSVIDYDCWVWKLEDTGKNIDSNIRNVNRVSSHFLIYNTERFSKFAKENDIYDFSKYNEDSNYEDVISLAFTNKKLPIAFFDNWEVKVRHCDDKQYEGSMFYKRDSQLKMKIAKEMIEKYSYNNKHE